MRLAPHALTDDTGLIMEPRAAPDPGKVEESGPIQPGYDQWKRSKIDQGLAQADERDKLIPSEQVWRDLGRRR